MTDRIRGANRRTLTAEEIAGVLRDVGWGVLAVGDEGGPYAVPIAYGFDGRALYIGTGPGRKLRGLERDPRACLTVTDATRPDGWRSVVATGQVRWLDDVSERARAICALTCQRRHGRRVGPAAGGQLTHLLRARLARIELNTLTGRRG